jgi:carbonic anhydrase
MEGNSFRSILARRIWSRRGFLKSATGSCLIAPPRLSSLLFATQGIGSLTKEQRDRMTPSEIIEEMRQGNKRFQAGKMASRDYRAEQRASAAGQYPAAVVLGCVDSRVPVEIIFDVGIGYTFNARIAGNVANADLLGSMEFACAVAGAKLVLVLGHTACGAIKGAIDGVVLGNLTGLLARIQPAIPATRFEGERSSKNSSYVDAVAKTNVELTCDYIRRQSPVLADLEKKGTIQITGSMYDLTTGATEFYA